MELGVISVTAITGICYLIGLIVKTTQLKDKWIPVICGISGGIIGIIALYIHMPDFPASDPINAIWVGIASGLAATGINQIFKQLKKKA